MLCLNILLESIELEKNHITPINEEQFVLSVVTESSHLKPNFGFVSACCLSPDFCTLVSTSTFLKQYINLKLNGLNMTCVF